MNASALSPVPHRRRRVRTSTGFLVAGVLLAWLTAPVRADIIDDFSGPKKFLLNGEPSASACSLADGQLKITVPKGESWAGALYLRNHLLPEGQAVEFRTDLVSASHAGVEVGLFVEFAGPYRTYGVVRWYDRVVLYKGWEDGACGFFDRAVETRTEPLTLSLTLTRQGSSLKVASKVALRDNPQEVIAEWEILDTPGADPAELNTDGPAPPLGLITDVGVVCLVTNPTARNNKLSILCE